jgi:hypothetical protein
VHIKKCSKVKYGFKFEVEVNNDEANYLFNYALNDLIKAGLMHVDLIDEAEYEYDLFKDQGGELS